MSRQLTTTGAATALRQAANLVRDADKLTALLPAAAGERCKLLGRALSLIQDAQIVLRNDPCWRARDVADLAARAERE